ncbi:DUF6082 family protein [Streptomyces sp. NPDC058284]|uniref:DUF6082 family protein n=1 Tax=unclassified Streptomyces TaxID=2593676 RepID=UPI00364FA7A4
MATQKMSIRGVGPAAVAGLSFATGTFMLLWSKGRRHSAHLARRERQAAERERAALALQRRNAALAEQHRLHFDLLCKAMGDTALAAVLDTYDESVPPERQRQFLFANTLYINALHAHRIGATTLQELYGHLRVMCQNPIFREFWEATRHHRASLDYASDEAKVGRVVDRLAEELDNAETERWWVVGEPPTE